MKTTKLKNSPNRTNQCHHASNARNWRCVGLAQLLTAVLLAQCVALAQETSYEVWRSTSPLALDVQRIAYSVTDTRFDDKAAVPGTTYYYWVKVKTVVNKGVVSGPIVPDGTLRRLAVIVTCPTTAKRGALTEVLVSVQHISDVSTAYPASGRLSCWLSEADTLADDTMASWGNYWTHPPGQRTVGAVYTNYIDLANYEGSSTAEVFARAKLVPDDGRLDLIDVNSKANRVHVRLVNTLDPAPTGVSASRGLYWDRVTVTWNAAGGNSSLSAAAMGFKGPPLPPGGVKATDGVYADKVRVTWNAAMGATGYDVWRSTVNAMVSAARTADNLETTSWDDTTAVPGTLYYYWVKSANGAGLSGFSTPAADGYRKLSAPDGVAATTGSYTDRIRISWNASAGARGYEVWRHTTSNASGAVRVATDLPEDSRAWNDREAVPGRLYYYWVKAVSTGGVSGFSTPAAGGLRKLLAPDGVTATDGVYTDKIRINWGACTGATGYEVWRHTSGDAALAKVVSKVTSTNWNDTAAVPGTLYWYWVKAVSSASGSDVSARGDTGYRTLLPPGGVAATDGTYSDEIRITWNGSTGAASYEVWRHTSNEPIEARRVVENVVTKYWDDTAAVPGVTYYYWVRAACTTGLSGFSTPAAAGYRKLSPPDGVAATTGTYTDRIRISWNASEGATGYEVWRHTASNASGAVRLAAELPEDSRAWNDREAVPGRPYYYWVKAVSTGGVSGFSTPAAGGLRKLLAPDGVTATDGVYTDKIRMSWGACTGATGYEVWRHTSGDAALAKVVSKVTSTNWNDTAVVPGTLYWYWVKAVSSTSASDLSAPGDTGYRTLLPPGGVAATDGTYSDKIRITWNGATGAASYEVWRHTSNEPTEARRVVENVVTKYWDDTAAVPGVTYYYWVRAVGAGTVSAVSNRETGLRASPSPARVVLRYEPQSKDVFVRCHADAGQSYTLEASADLVDWVEIATMTIDAGGQSPELPASNEGAARFFRVRWTGP